MARRSTELWWRQHWGPPCQLHDPTIVHIRGQPFRTDGRMVAAWEALDTVFARHNIVVNPPFPRGDSGMYNCRHIGNDPNRPMSVHAWAGALDRNWNQNPDGSRLVTDLPQHVINEVHALRTKSGAPVFRWGGDWDRDPRTDHSYYDAMHFEITAAPAEIRSGIIDPYAPQQRKGLLMALSDAEQDRLLARVDAIYEWLVNPNPQRDGKPKGRTDDGKPVADLYRWSEETVVKVRDE